MKKINQWIAVFYIGMLIVVLATAVSPFGRNMLWDTLHVIGQLAIAVGGFVVLYKVHRRDESVNENETLRNLIYYKEHSRKQKDFPLSISLMMLFGITMVLSLGVFGFGYVALYIL